MENNDESIDNIGNGNENEKSRKLSYLNDKFCVYFLCLFKMCKMLFNLNIEAIQMSLMNLELIWCN